MPRNRADGAGGSSMELHFSQDFGIDVEDDGEELAGRELAVPGGRHEHLLKSGLLGRCDDPFCTTCPSYIDYSAGSQMKKSRNLFSEAKSVALGIVKWRPAIYNPHTKVIQRWNQVFGVCCLIAVFVDPLFFFIFSAKQGYFCIVFNQELAIGVTIVRSIFDGIYFIHMLLQFRLAYFALASQTSGTGVLIDDPKTIALHYLQSWMVRFLPLLFGRSQSGGYIFETAWANFTINLFIYLLAGHVVGSCWYLFGLQRVNQCLINTCRAERPVCRKEFLDCGNGHNIQALQQGARLVWTNSSNASSKCLVNASFAYGIYSIAVPVAMDDSAIHKYVYSLFWGFLQISTLGGNLQPSLFVGEVFFTFGVIGLGLLLFALLIGNMQNFLQSLGRRHLEMQLRRHDVERWMRRRELPVVLRKRVRQAVRLKWASTRGVNEEELLDRLPEDMQKEIRRFLCFELLTKVRLFTVMDDKVLDAICQRLHEMLYIEGSEVFLADAPIHRMIFVVRGTLDSVWKNGNTHTLVSGDFCGEELLHLCLNEALNTRETSNSEHSRRDSSAPTRGLAFSTRTVRCSSSVEAFSLEEKDLRYVVANYISYIRNPRVLSALKSESHYFRSNAARRIQAAWKSHIRRQSRNPLRS
ncbi:probable cyclic nucleotide-gated ion channel 20, chloroplastic [Selaginella moellendorffii]|uniref:probable cyclic nucleotide-gated ion channel 20, chloroplastic n=1 Tax=Selaginella moellendorffii TaxID=88036 RepID=UPI000D1CAEAA|nr:probable cyclic nucleotide-gated ion channel 20, chloroplastic [Selaginella moellendorffii]|eukprot:XP_024530875.1 probable cyclic nucleotide-gated ion channel 20, chloroplastic [Selaginella moellendorffii]